MLPVALSDVHWDEKEIRTIGKGRRRVKTAITSVVREILWPLQGHHPEFVFTYIAQRTRAAGQIKGERYPLTKGNVASVWKRIRSSAGISAGIDGFRFHDFRHNFGTKLLRQTGNLKLVQKALNHAEIKTTMRYAHVLEDEVAAALEQFAQSRKKASSSGDAESRKRSRSTLREVS